MRTLGHDLDELGRYLLLDADLHALVVFDHLGVHLHGRVQRALDCLHLFGQRLQCSFHSVLVAFLFGHHVFELRAVLSALLAQLHLGLLLTEFLQGILLGDVCLQELFQVFLQLADVLLTVELVGLTLDDLLILFACGLLLL